MPCGGKQGPVYPEAKMLKDVQVARSQWCQTKECLYEAEHGPSYEAWKTKKPQWQQ